jgi:hypothetical protein
MEVLDDIVQFSLVVGIWCNNEISSGQDHIEAKECINIITMKIIAPVGDYSTVTLFARLRGWSTSVPLRQAT